MSQRGGKIRLFTMATRTWGAATCASALILGGWTPALFAEEGRRAPYALVQSSTTTIAVDQEVGDLLLIDGGADIGGVVRGHVYSIDSNIVVRSTAVILGSMTLNRGTLRMEEGAVLPPTITLADADLLTSEGAALPRRSGRVEIGRGATTVALSSTRLSTVSVALLKNILPFDRFVPREGVRIGALESWHPGLGLVLKKEDPSPSRELVIGGITRLTFVSKKVKGAFQRGYKGARGTVLLSVVELEDDAAARALWKEVERVAPEEKVSLSVRSALGDGAHWYFRHRNRHCMLWQRGPWFVAVETKLAADQSTIFQEKQFSDQVLSQLRSGVALFRSTERAEVPANARSSPGRADLRRPPQGVTR